MQPQYIEADDITIVDASSMYGTDISSSKKKKYKIEI
jgi:hypothetical protein